MNGNKQLKDIILIRIGYILIGFFIGFLLGYVIVTTMKYNDLLLISDAMIECYCELYNLSAAVC